MKQFQHHNKNTYKNIQISSSSDKFKLCKVSFSDVVKYIDIIRNYYKFIYWSEPNKKLDPLGPILSLGVRNGREVNLFRIAIKNNIVFNSFIHKLERFKNGLQCTFPILENLNHSDYNNITDYSSIGVEINPKATRKDIWIGSFDELPVAWHGKFRIIYTNAFDHAFDAYSTAEIWKKCLMKGGFIILCFPETHSINELDPVGEVNLDDMLKLFPGELIYYHTRGSKYRYTEYIIKM